MENIQPHNGVLKPTEKGREIDPPPPKIKQENHQAKRKTKPTPLSPLHNTRNRSQAGRKQSTLLLVKSAFVGSCSMRDYL